MSRQRNAIPTYLHHSRLDRARAVWTDAAGVRRFRLLPGAYDSPESRTAYATLVLEIEAVPHQVTGGAANKSSIAEVLLSYLNYAEG